jgi:methylated-DNA-[protein]-cysteine S-methyltransferase
MTLATEAIAGTCTARSVIGTPVGPILLARTAQGLAGAWFLDDQQHHPRRFEAPDLPEDPLLATVAGAFTDYFAGRSMAWDSVVLDPVGSPFQLAVWRELRAIAPGTTTTYGAIAAALGVPGSARAVGTAVGRNPLGIVVPCHRVIGSDGSLTGYAGGLARKRTLLRLEAEWRAGQPGGLESAGHGNVDAAAAAVGRHPASPPASAQTHGPSASGGAVHAALPPGSGPMT